MRRHSFIGAVAAGALALGGAAGVDAQPAPGAPDQPQVPTGAIEPADAGRASGQEVTIEGLMGQTVQGTGGETLGTVKDVVLDPGSGQLSQIVIGTGGFLGIGEKRVAIPWEDVRLGPGAVTVARTPDDIREAEPFEGAEEAATPRGDSNSAAGERPPTVNR